MRTLLEEKAGFAIVFMARMLEVSTQGYYAWLDREASPRDLRSVSLKEAIRKIHTDSEGVYGTPRILEELGKAGWVVSRKTVAKSTKESGIAGISPRSYVTTTVRDGSDSYPADLVKRRSDRNGI